MVAAIFKAAGRRIGITTVTNWKRNGWQGAANAPRTDRPTPTEGKAIWDSLEKPNFEKVAEAFKAQGRPISSVTISHWHRAGWSSINPKNVVGKINRAVEKIAAAVPALTGNATSTLSDILMENDVMTDERGNDRRGHSECVEHALLRAIRTATAVNDAIHDIAAAVPKAGVDIPKDAPLPWLLTQPGGIAQLMMASNAGISVTIEGMRQLPAMRAEAAAAVPGTQTVYLPGESDPQEFDIETFKASCKHLTEPESLSPERRAELAAEYRAMKTQYKPGQPLRSSMEAYAEELAQIMEGKYDRV
jgi:hypothetical protein